MLNILIMGAGAIGCFIGGHLAAAGHQVTLVGLSDLIPKIATAGLVLRWPNQSDQTVFPPTATTLVPPKTPYDFIVFTVKSPDTATAAQQLAALPLVTTNTHVISFQNGIGNEERLAELFGKQQVMAGTLTIPISLPELGVIEVSKAKGGLGVAPLAAGQPVDILTGALNQAGLPTTTYTDYRAMKWTKLLLNILCNASSAILNETPAQVLACTDLFNMEINALREGTDVIKAQGVKVVKLPGYPSVWMGRAVAARWLPLPVTRALLGPFARGGRGRKMPSLQIDLAAGRPTSEIEVMNGAIVRAGQEVGVPTPVNSALTTILRGLFAGELNWNDYQHRPDKLLAAIQNESR